MPVDCSVKNKRQNAEKKSFLFCASLHLKHTNQLQLHQIPGLWGVLHFITVSLLHSSSNVETSNSSLSHQPKHTHTFFSGLDILQRWSLEPRRVPRLPFDTHKHTYANDPAGFFTEFCSSGLKSLNTCGNFRVSTSICDKLRQTQKLHVPTQSQKNACNLKQNKNQYLNV